MISSIHALSFAQALTSSSSIETRFRHTGLSNLWPRFLLGSIGIIAIAVTIYQVHVTATIGFEIRKLENERERLSDQVLRHERTYAERTSVHAFLEYAASHGYVPTQQFVFLDQPSPQVAKR